MATPHRVAEVHDGRLCDTLIVAACPGTAAAAFADAARAALNVPYCSATRRAPQKARPKFPGLRD